MKRTVLAALFAAALLAQTPADSRNFDVASVKLTKERLRPEAGTKIQLVRATPTSLTMRPVPLDFCIAWAYQLQPYQITGAKLPTDNYEIAAKTTTATSIEDLRAMLKALLTERFHLTMHRDTKVMSVYALSQGPKPHLELADGADSNEEMMIVANGPGVPALNHLTMFDFAMMLSDILSTPVADRTGLTGRFNIKLDGSSVMRTNPGSEDGRAAWVAMIQDQLGMKLESKKLPIEVLVIDHVEKPAEN